MTQDLLVPAEKFSVRMLMMGLELATPRLQTVCSSHRAIQLKRYCWEGVEFIHLVYCIIIFIFGLKFSECCKLCSAFRMLQILYDFQKCCKGCRTFKMLPILQCFQNLANTTETLNNVAIVSVLSKCCRMLQSCKKCS